MKKIICLKESDLHRIIKESIDELTAYHGSTTKGLKKFDLNFSSTDSNRQKMGFGIYVAVDEETAKSYTSNNGSLYEVEIPDDNGHNYFDFDKEAPIPKHIINAIKKIILSNEEIVDMWGKDNLLNELRYFNGITYHELEGTMNYFLGNGEDSSRRNAQILNGLGMIGVKSNDKALGTSIYLIYNPNNVKIISEKY